MPQDVVVQAAQATAQPAQAPAVPVPPAPPAPGLPGSPQVITTTQLSGDPALVYQALREQRDVLRSWQERAENRREEIQNDIRQATTDADRAALQQRLAETDKRILELDQQIRDVEGQAARAAAVPGAIQPEPVDHGPPDEVFVIPIVFTIFVLAPIAVAFARRIWKRTGVVVSGIPDALMERLGRMEQAVDAIAVEVERVSEGQRFLTKVMSEVPRGIGAGAAQPVEVKAREGVNVPR